MFYLEKEDNFWPEWHTLSVEEQWQRAEKSDWIITEAEPLFDAADVARFGRDLFVQKSMVTNDAGIDWLRRHYPNHRVHKVSYMELLPWHIDATLIPLRPGLVLVNPERPPLREAHNRLFEINGWELLEAPRSVRTKKMPLCTCSLWLNMSRCISGGCAGGLFSESDRGLLDLYPITLIEVRTGLLV